MQRILIFAGGLVGFGTVGMAALGSHLLSGRLEPGQLHLVDVAVQMQGWHALALLACGLWVERGGFAARLAGVLFLIGTVLFCGALYMLALADTHLGPAAPTGGLCLMAGWLALAASAFRRA